MKNVEVVAIRKDGTRAIYILKLDGIGHALEHMLVEEGHSALALNVLGGGAEVFRAMIKA
jgi:predicted Fe-Mo cluster-binding NifX family protein